MIYIFMMGKEYRAKTFKSGNSVALRLPKAAGFVEGEDVVIVPHADDRFTIYKASETADILRGLAGSLSPGFMANGRGDIEQAERDWSPRHDGAEAA